MLPLFWVNMRKLNLTFVSPWFHVDRCTQGQHNHNLEWLKTWRKRKARLLQTVKCYQRISCVLRMQWWNHWKYLFNLVWQNPVRPPVDDKERAASEARLKSTGWFDSLGAGQVLPQIKKFKGIYLQIKSGHKGNILVISTSGYDQVHPMLRIVFYQVYQQRGLCNIVFLFIYYNLSIKVPVLKYSLTWRIVESSAWHVLQESGDELRRPIRLDCSLVTLHSAASIASVPRHPASACIWASMHHASRRCPSFWITTELASSLFLSQMPWQQHVPFGVTVVCCWWVEHAWSVAARRIVRSCTSFKWQIKLSLCNQQTCLVDWHLHILFQTIDSLPAQSEMCFHGLKAWARWHEGWYQSSTQLSTIGQNPITICNVRRVIPSYLYPSCFQFTASPWLSSTPWPT